MFSARFGTSLVQDKMMRKLLILLVIAFLAMPAAGGPDLALFASAPALAQQDQNDALKARKRGNLIPYGQISRRAERQFKGRVVGQRVRQYSRNRWVYELRILRQDGQVISVVIDAHTGEVLGSRGR
jgi:uncharacterized iron-regulated membrane protein